MRISAREACVKPHLRTRSDINGIESYHSKLNTLFYDAYPKVFPTYHRILQKHVRNISNLSLQLKYCRNIFVKYCELFHCNITILTF